MPASTARFDIVKKNATIPDTLRLIVAAVNVYEHSPFVIGLTKQLNTGGSKYDFIKRVFDFVCRNVPYILDTPGDEEVWSPELTLREKKGDCKKMTVLIASILKCAGIEPICKHVYYHGSDNTHIYVVVPFPDLKHYLTVDPVNYKQWNTEVDNIRSASLHFLNGKVMDLHMMGARPQVKTNWGGKLNTNIYASIRGIDDDLSFTAGMGCPSIGSKENVLADALQGDFRISGIDDDEIISGMGRRRGGKNKAAKKAKRVERRKKLFHVFKAVNLGPSRASFLLLVRSNIFKLANRMAKIWIHNPDALINMWKQFGGNPDKLKQTIKAGAWKDIAKDIRGIGSLGDRIPSVAELEAMEVNGMGFPPAIAAAIAAATPLVLATIKIIGKSKDDQDDGSESNAEIATKAVSESASAYADADSDEATEGVGENMAYEHDEDHIVSGIGQPYDYIDGMGRKRKKNKPARADKKAAKKAKKEARKAAKKAKKKKGHGAPDDEGDPMNEGGDGSDIDVSDHDKRTKFRLKSDDVKVLSTLAEYGTKKILEGKVTKDMMNKIKVDDGGTHDTPLAAPEPDDAKTENNQSAKSGEQTPPPTTKPSETMPTAGSFGLTAINSLPEFLHWFKGAAVILLASAGTFEIVADVFVIGSLVYFTRSHIWSFTRKFLTLKK